MTMANKNCDNCVYRAVVGGVDCCGYLFKTGHRRPCPPGDECTVKVGREVKRRKKTKNSAIDSDLANP